MTTMCYSHESAPGVSPARGLDETAKFLASLDSPQSNLSPDDFSPPRPRFVFPAAPPSPDLSPPSHSARRRRPLSAVETHTTSFSLAVASTERMTRHAALPDFSFNPGAALPPSPNVQLFLSPPEPFNASRPISSSARPGGHGHRRGGSEFVGGRLREGSSIAVLNASSTKPETAPPLPLPSLQLPPPGRRGHRRGVSGTISTNDLPLIAPPLLQAPFHKASSIPSSPTSSGPEKPCLPLGLDDSPALMQSSEPVQPLEHTQVVHNSDADTARVPVAEDATEKTQHLPKPLFRARVGFSDTLEFIPRPSSLISTDTSSTMTVRPGHSVSGSISSVISGAPGGIESPALLSRVPTGEQADNRPSTASIILDRATEFQPPSEESVSSRRRNSIPVLWGATADDTLASAMPSSMKTPKRWSFFGFESLTGAASPSRLRSSSSSSSDSTPRATCSGSSDHESDISAEGSEDACKPKKGGKKRGKKNRVKGWAGSILPRKSKGKKPLKVSRPPTPPASISHLEDEEDEDTQSVGSKEPVMASLPAVRVIEPQSPRPRRTRDESSFAMIDLDAALGPFNTPLSYNAEWEAAQHAADNSTMRRLHSAQGMRGFSGPGMHYHRRSESAPALPPFESGRAFINRFGSNSTMADVFEEDEEDEDEEADRCTSETDESLDGESAHSPFPSLDALVADPQDESSRVARRRSLGSADGEPLGIHPVRTESSRTLLQGAVIAEAPQGQSMSDTRALQGSRDSFESGSPSLRRFPGLHDHAMADDGPFSLSNSSGVHFGSYTMSSSHPSPRSPISVDAQRISTAPSSVTDANSFHSLLMGEPGPEVRISMDYDIPSLTSSPSTMTRDSTPLPMPRANQPAPREQRPVSVSAAFGRRRSSLVSLSRLISSSHGERSKLSMEVTLPSEAPHEKKSKNKASRLSRMMQFWKPNKDGAAPEQSKVPRTTLK